MNIDRTKLKNSNGVKLTRGLFYETSLDPLRTNVLYTLRKDNHLGYPSLYLLYLASSLLDPTEYRFAQSYFVDWEHWVEVSNSLWIKDYLSVWRAEAAVAIESQYLSLLADLARKGGKEAFPALRYLLERLEKATGSLKPGRPTKASTLREIERTAFLDDLNDKRVNQDFERILNG